MSMQRAFTFRNNGIARVLKTPSGVCLPFTEEQAKQGHKPEIKQYVAIWDTGATNSVITQKVVNDLQLKPIAVTEMHHAGGTSISNVYLVNIVLPDSVIACFFVSYILDYSRKVFLRILIGASLARRCLD